MAWTLLGGHSCEPEAVTSGYCSECGTTWTYEPSEWEATKAALKGHDVRDAQGKKLPLI